MDDIFHAFNKHKVRYLLIGGQAMRLLGLPRFTMDWDLFVPPWDQANFDLINRLIEEYLDMPVLPLGPNGEHFIQTYQTQWAVLQFHLVLPGVPGFDEAEKDAKTARTESGLELKRLSGRHLLQSKRAINRDSDQVDIDFLLELDKLGKLD